MPTLMPANGDAVYPHNGFVIHRAEIQKDAFSRPLLRHTEAPAVPDTRVEGSIADSAQLGLNGERHHNLAVEARRGEPALFQTNITRVKAELPHAIQIQPFWPYELRPGVFGARDLMFCRSDGLIRCCEHSDCLRHS